MQRRQRHGESGGRTVGIGDHEAAGLASRRLALQEFEVIAVDFGDHQRNVGMHAEGAGIRHNGAAGVGETWLGLFCHGAIERRKNDAWRACGIGGGNRHLRNAARDGRCQPPARGLLVAASGGADRGSKPCNFKPGMLVEHLDQALTDHAGRAQNAYGNSAITHNGVGW